MLIAFEGMDGSGKSSISKAVSQRINIKHETQKIVKLLNVDLPIYKDFISKIRKSSNKRLALIFYTFRCMLDKEENEDLIVERSMISTYYYEHNKISDEEFSYLLSLDCIPDITFILYASSEERKKRIFYRDSQDEDLKSEEALFDGYKDMLECANKFNFPYIGLNTEKYSYEEIIDICSNIIKDFKSLDENERINYISKMNDEFGFDYMYKERVLVLSEKEI